jgi:alanine racemase
LSARAAPAETAAVVKADAYGLGVARVAPALWRAGCRRFFVAHVDGGIALRHLLRDAWIAVLFGVAEDETDAFDRYDLVPVLNHLGQIEAWADAARDGHVRSAVLQVDTGMTRLGLPADELARLNAEPARLRGLDIAYVMRHLACAEQTSHPEHEAPRLAFNEKRAVLAAHVRRRAASLANSSGIFLGRDFHHQMVRPGAALYGVNPTPHAPNPMAEVVNLKAKIVQVQSVDSGQTVGYGATHRVERPSRIATVSAGYADGYLRGASSRAHGILEGISVPVVGRVSMDMLTFDVTDVPPETARPGAMITLIGGAYPVDALAADAGTIGYEILTALGSRYRRHYIGGASEAAR